MLRELVAWVLNNYLGKYVENLNTAQLSVALLSGEVELENLPLRRDALRNLGLPLHALSGSIGKVKLHVPVRQFRTAPWRISIEKVYVVLGPINLDEWDAESEEQADLDYKLSRLDRLEAIWRAEKEAAAEGSYYASSYSGWLSYGTSVITNIVENLQLQIKDVHIRYEDSITVPRHQFACGITIESLSAQSCDPNWQPGFTNAWNQSAASFKLVELQALSFYWDPLRENETFGDTNSTELADAMHKHKWTHRYVISPVSAEAHFKRDRSENPLRTRSRPRLVCDLVWNEVSLSLNDWQYDQMVECVRGLDDVAKYRSFKLLRPKNSIATGAKSWWIYAARCHGYRGYADSSKRLKIAKENIKYISIYSKIMRNPNESLLTEDKEFKDTIERERLYDDLRVLREICMLQQPSTMQPMQSDSRQQGRSMLLHWFPQWMGWYNNNSPPTEELEHKDHTSTLDDEVLNALAAGSAESNSLLKRDAVFGKFDFTLKKGTLDVSSGLPNQPNILMMQLQFENLHLSVESRPRSGSHYLALSLGSFFVKDFITPNSEFPDLIRPQAKEEALGMRLPGQRSQRSSTVTSPSVLNSEPLFQLVYERKPLSYNTDYRLMIKSQSLDIVYNTDALKWLIDFISKPHQVFSARKKIEAMKNKTKMELIKNWEQMLEGDLSQRKSWAFDIDILAPQIIFVSNSSDKNSSVVVLDFGHLQLSNNHTDINNINISDQCKDSDMNSQHTDHRDSEDEDAFMTPCSTPPGSEASTSDSPTLCSAFSDVPTMTNPPSDTNTLNESALYDKLYDRYNLTLTDLQVLVCRGRERWGFANSKGTSNRHVLDRFNISLQVERRVVPTTDPQYPSLTVSGTLPKLVAHVNEQKIAAIVHMFEVVSSNASQSPSRSPADAAPGFEQPVSEVPVEADDVQIVDEEEAQREASKIIILQFSVDQMTLEVQSCNRSIAELQVTGVKAGFNKRPADTSFTLSVHGLLLVDGIQSFGPDFELLIASHRHVGMDSISGSLKQSEPCSPISPGSPDPMQDRRPTSPHTISRALSNLQRANSCTWSATGNNDLDALIIVEVLFVTPTQKGEEELKIANIQFNNLDIIANQETIVELIGFAKKVLPDVKSSTTAFTATATSKPSTSMKESDIKEPPIRTEITFDFHRLNVLVLRALMRDSFVVGRKVGTFTMSEARIHATVGPTIVVEGSLGGLQVLDLTPEGVNHQRILSVGKDPLTEPPDDGHQDLLTSLTQEIYAINGQKNDSTVCDVRQALSFRVSRNLNAVVEIKIRMASVWYTHCARFMQELSWCAIEFKHYLKNLARSIREKATDMALGLVQPRPDMNTSFINESPRKSQRNRAASMCWDQHAGKKVDIRLDIVLDTPVLVVPRSSCSPQVFVAHLGKITISNEKQLTNEELAEKLSKAEQKIFTISEENSASNEYLIEENDELTLMDDGPPSRRLSCDDVDFGLDCDQQQNEMETYSIDVRNMNLFTLDTSNRKGFRLSALPRAEEFYSCEVDAIPVLHDTAIRLELIRTVEYPCDFTSDAWSDIKDTLHIKGCVVRPLQLSLTRKQYEQLLETFDNIFKVPPDIVRPKSENPKRTGMVDPDEENFSQFEMNNKSKIRWLNQSSFNERRTVFEPKVTFDLPIFVVQLKGERNDPLIEISFRDFNFSYEKNNTYETNIQISLRSLLMEDLLQSPDSKHRAMVVSSADKTVALRPDSAFSSRSCPNLVGLQYVDGCMTGSLPENLESNAGFGPSMAKTMCPDTPPPSPQPKMKQDNLVIYSSLLVDPECPNFEHQYKSFRQQSSIDFNSLDLVISVQSWFVLLNFFGLLSDESDEVTPVSDNVVTTSLVEAEQQNKGNSELEVSVRSLNVVFIRTDYEIAKANVSNAKFCVSKLGVSKQVEGKLGSMSLLDLTSHGCIYKERFLTSGNEALNFVYVREAARAAGRSLNTDAKLHIQMSSVKYVHTKRFVMEIQAFFRDFLQLQTPVMRKIKPNDSRNNQRNRPTQLGLEITAGSPIIVLPMSSRSDQVLVADLGEFSLSNSFHLASDRDVISVKKIVSGFDEILDLMQVNLVNTDIFAGVRCMKSESRGVLAADPSDLDMSGYLVKKVGPCLLKNKCHLRVHVERNMDTLTSHNVPDFSVQGTLSRLEAVLDLEQYKLVRGFLSYNLGEEIDDLYTTPFVNESKMNLNADTSNEEVWTNMSITLDLQDVSVRLHMPNSDSWLLDSTPNLDTQLACINFIKSTLKIDSYSDGSQDIDLVSQEISITDSRSGSRNVFTSILQPIHSIGTDTGLVQAEIHSRKRMDHSKYTILLNNMRLMAILDWLESVRDYLSQNAEEPRAMYDICRSRSGNDTVQEDSPIELKLNITDSELVFVEKTDQFDTNAVILKSTTVVSYRPAEIEKVMSINLNHLEVFSCILGMEDDTALSIIDPVTLNLDLTNNVMVIQMQKQLCVRLSYHDVKMFAQMLESLPQQTKHGKSQELRKSSTTQMADVTKLVSLGFKNDDCMRALDLCSGHIDEAALWLTQNAEPNRNNFNSNRGSPLTIQAIEMQANLISICVIDDCKDADVPLLELSLAQLDLRQEISGGITPVSTSFGSSSTLRTGHLKAILSSDYYNRGLSGWEPLVEQWKCDLNWCYSIGVGDLSNRLLMNVNSDSLLKLNVTSTIIELFRLVHDNWSQDFYGVGNGNGFSKVGNNSSPTAIRRRSPFVPFALKNETGVRLWFTTLVSSTGGLVRNEIVSHTEGNWHVVEPGQVIPFSFGHPNKLRHHDTHKLNLHQVGIRLEGWREVGPISVDKVGVYFRHTRSDTSDMRQIPRARVVFSVTLEGSAQKLVTVRSALRLINKLNNPMLLKMEHHQGHMNITNWPLEEKTAIVPSLDSYNIPLNYVHSFLYLRPLTPQLHNLDATLNNVIAKTDNDNAPKFNGNDYWSKVDRSTFSVNNSFLFCDRPIHWNSVADASEVHQELRTCKSNREKWFRFVATVRRENYPTREHASVPGHSIVVLPPLRLHNLLPCDLLYKLPSGTEGRISQSETAHIHEVDLEESVDISLTLDGYPGAARLLVPSGNYGSMEAMIRLTDTRNRLLCLKSFIQLSKGGGMQISVSAPFWLINRTGLPLVFRQEGVAHESAGQSMENEQARLVSPMMFSFSDLDASPALSVRLGQRFGSAPKWCQPFNLHESILHRQLRSQSTNEVYVIGIEVRRGRGRYCRTSVVTFSPRFQLYNRSKHKLQFAQKCFATTVNDLRARQTFIEAVPDCHLPFHWPRSDHEQELCVRLSDVKDCMWSGSIRMETKSLYINIRNKNGAMHFLRLEIVLQGATYFLLFGDAQTLPPPIRIDNYSDVTMTFFQPGNKQWRTSVKAHSSIAYVLDEPSGCPELCIEAPGGVSHNYPLEELGLSHSHHLTYENFIYIAFSETFGNLPETAGMKKEFDFETPQLVLTVIEGRVILVPKQQGNRAQLWRMNKDKQLEHEGSSPPTEPGKTPSSSSPRYVLDLEKPPQLSQAINLVVRPANRQRKSTQTWNFTEEGRLMCEHANMCVQPRGGIFELRPGTEAVLGDIKSSSHSFTKKFVPLEQAIERQKLRPGSGYLSVTVSMDGPIKTLQIKDVKSASNIPLAVDPEWRHVSHIIPQGQLMQQSGKSLGKRTGEYHVKMCLTKGVGISLVSKRPCEELAFITLENILMEVIITPAIHMLDLSIGDMQIDNQLFETPCPIMMFSTKAGSSGWNGNGAGRSRPAAAHLNIKMLPSPNANAVIFEHLVLSFKPISVYLEERLILKFAIFTGLGYSQVDPASLPDESDYEAQRIATKVLDVNAKRIYFGDLQIVPIQIKLSVITAPKLSAQLAEMKKSLGLILVKFEDAILDFDKFKNVHHFETMEVHLRTIKLHYIQELKWQTASIIASVDFLGNPLGLANDVTEGVSRLLSEGSVKSLVKNVTHGLSNSTAKLTETLSDGLGRVVLDEQDTETRQRILEVASGANSTGDHLMAGLRGFGFGLLGGVTSIVKSTYSGAQSDGFPGLLSGFGKGIVGTVTKPVIGVLDLASETANAVRETSRSSNRILPDRKRLPRCVTGAPGGLLPPFSHTQSEGQQHLFLINKRDFTEQFMAYQPALLDNKESKLRLLVSTENFWVFSRTEDTTTIVLSYHLSELLSCHAVSVSSDNHRSTRLQHYIELCLSISNKAMPSEMVRRPRVRCQTEEMAQKASRHINYAKSVYDERQHTLNAGIVIE